MSDLPFAATTPIHVGRVGLRARDADSLANYYKAVLGLVELRRHGSIIALGAGGRELLEIEGKPTFDVDDPRSAGLFHTAFLLPSRADLARWTRHAADTGIAVDGASDHLVSEALYLTDPEGNGIEIYADRPRESWAFDGGEVQMTTAPLDFEDLMREVEDKGTAWTEAPDETVIGHVHLRVGNAREAEQWWNGTRGLDTMAHYGEAAVFLSSGGYHHHIGANSWQSRGAGQRDPNRTGLAFVELLSGQAETESAFADPWGNEIRMLSAGG